MTTDTPVVLGLDLSLTGTGIANTHGLLGVVGRDGITKLPLRERVTVLADMADKIMSFVVIKYDMILVEGPSFASKGGGALERHALWWEVVSLCFDTGCPVAVIPPTSLTKYAAGKGNASKEAVVDAVARRWPKFITNGNNNAADSAVLVAMGMDHLGHPFTVVPATHRVALDKIVWPETVEAK